MPRQNQEGAGRAGKGHSVRRAGRTRCGAGDGRRESLRVGTGRWCGADRPEGEAETADAKSHSLATTEDLEVTLTYVGGERAQIPQAEPIFA